MAASLALAVLALLSACGSSSTTPTPTITAIGHTPKGQPVDNFVWPFYGYAPDRARAFAAPSNVAPPLRKGWHFNNLALLEFPPVIYHNALFFVDYTASVKALNKVTGHVIWQHRVGSLSAVTPGLDTRHGLVFVPLMSTTPGAKVAGHGRFVAMSMKTGRVVWSRSIPAGSETSPLVVGSNVYIGDQGGTVYSFKTANGHLNWTFHGSGAIKGGLAYSRGNVYFDDYASRVYSLIAATGHERWASSAGAGTFYSTPAVAFGRVYAGNTNGHIYAFSQSSGQELWSAATGSYVYSSPAVANIKGLGQTVFSGSYDGNFYALNASSGAIRWRHPSGAAINGSGTIIGNVIYYGVLRVHDTLGLNVRTGRQVLRFPDGVFAGAVADRHALYVIGYSTIYQLLPKR